MFRPQKNFLPQTEAKGLNPLEILGLKFFLIETCGMCPCAATNCGAPSWSTVLCCHLCSPREKSVSCICRSTARSVSLFHLITTFIQILRSLMSKKYAKAVKANVHRCLLRTKIVSFLVPSALKGPVEGISRSSRIYGKIPIRCLGKNCICFTFCADTE